MNPLCFSGKVSLKLSKYSCFHTSQNNFKGQLQCQNKFCSKESLLVIMIHGINYFFIICLDEAIIELENSTLRLRFISGSNH